MSTTTRDRYRFIRDQFLSLLVGACVGLLILSILILPHDWNPMGRWGTFYVFSMFLGGAHILIWVFVLVPFALWAEIRQIRKGMFQVFVFGAALYGAAALVIQLCFDHLGLDSFWFLCLAFPVGGITSQAYAFLRRRAEVNPTRYDPGT